MTVGLSMISALLAERRTAQFRLIREDHFTEDELPAWRLLSDYHLRHGGLPTPQVFAENGITLIPASGNFSYHVDRVRTRAVYNAVRENILPIQNALATMDMDEAVAAMNTMQEEVSRARTTDSILDIAEWSRLVREGYDDAHILPDSQGVTLGFEPLDRLTNGAYPGDVVAIVARPGIGKTYTIIHMALEAWKEGRKVLLITKEMTDAQIAYRMVGLHSRIDPAFIKRGQVSQWMWPEFQRALDEFQLEHGDGRSLYLVGGRVANSVRDIDSLVQEIEPDVVYIDASYLLKPENSRNRSRHEMLADIGEGIKDVALNRSVPVVHSVQFGRAAEKKRKSKAGDTSLGFGLDMIGGTDVVGQIATLVIGIAEGIRPHERTQRRHALLKNREGPLGMFTTNFLFAPINFDVVRDNTALERDTEEHNQNLIQDMQDRTQ